MDISPLTVTLPLALVLTLNMLMQGVKPLLEQYVPGFAVGSATHDTNLRIVYGVLAFLAIGGYALLTMPTPATVDGWIALGSGVIVAAQSVLGVGHVAYKVSQSGGGGIAPADSQPVQPSDPNPGNPGDFPPGAPSLAALGLPSEADVSEQDTAVSLPAAA